MEKDTIRVRVGMGCGDWDTTQVRTKATRKVGIRHAHKEEEKDWDRGGDEDKNT